MITSWCGVRIGELLCPICKGMECAGEENASDEKATNHFIHDLFHLSDLKFNIGSLG